MKKNTILFGTVLGLLALSHQASAQITITQADLPYANLRILTEIDSTNLPAPGGPSASAQPWDFSGLTKQVPEVTLFVDASSTKYASAFPKANLADSTAGVNGYDFLSDTTSNLSAVGQEAIVTYQGNIFQVEISLSPLFEQSPLPATYGTTITPGTSRGSETFTKNVTVGPFTATQERFTANIQYSDTVDAWGTMKMPNGKTYNVLREKHHEVDYDSLFGYIFGTWTYVERVVTHNNEYKWYTNGLGYTLVQMNMDSAFTGATSVVWLDTNINTAGIANLSIKNNVNAYPNPANTSITFNTANALVGNAAQFIAIYDVTGRQVEQVAIKNGVSTLNTAAYSNGLYLYSLTNSSGNMLDQGKFIVQH